MRAEASRLSYRVSPEFIDRGCFKTRGETASGTWGNAETVGDGGRHIVGRLTIDHQELAIRAMVYVSDFNRITYKSILHREFSMKCKIAQAGTS